MVHKMSQKTARIKEQIKWWGKTIEQKPTTINKVAFGRTFHNNSFSS